jgi:hypothetical protein
MILPAQLNCRSQRWGMHPLGERGGLISLLPRPAAIYIRSGAANAVLTLHAGTVYSVSIVCISMIRTHVVLSPWQTVQDYCTVGWVDIGTRARVPFRFVVYLKKVGKKTKNCFFQVTTRTSELAQFILYSTLHKAGIFL